VDGRKAIEGVLEAYDGENVTVLTDKDNLETYSLKHISKINRVILF
jgi:ribosome maturation factor RimP